MTQTHFGQVDTARKLITPRSIDGQSFDGTADIGTGQWLPSHYGLKAWTYDLNQIYTGSGISSATVYVAAIPIPVATTITSVLLYVTDADSGLTSGQCFAHLYQGGVLLGSTASQHSAWASAGMKSMALSGGPVSVAAGFVQVGFHANGNTSLKFGRSINSYAAAVNAASVHRMAYTNTGGVTTTAPNPLGAVTDFQNSYWAAAA